MTQHITQSVPARIMMMKYVKHLLHNISWSRLISYHCQVDAVQHSRSVEGYHPSHALVFHKNLFTSSHTGDELGFISMIPQSWSSPSPMAHNTFRDGHCWKLELCSSILRVTISSHQGDGHHEVCPSSTPLLSAHQEILKMTWWRIGTIHTTGSDSEQFSAPAVSMVSLF